MTVQLTPSKDAAPEDQMAAFLLFVPLWLRPDIQQRLEAGDAVRVQHHSAMRHQTIFINEQPYISALDCPAAERVRYQVINQTS